MASVHGIVDRIEDIEDRLTVVERATVKKSLSSSSTEPVQISVALIRVTPVFQDLEDTLTTILNNHLNVKVAIQTLNMSTVVDDLSTMSELHRYDFAIVVGFTTTSNGRFESQDLVKTVQYLVNQAVPLAILILRFGASMSRVEVNHLPIDKRIRQFNMNFQKTGIIRTTDLTQEAISGLVEMIKTL